MVESASPGHHAQCDQIGRFLKADKVTKFVTNVTRMYGDICDNFEKLTFKWKLLIGNFCTNFAYVRFLHLVTLIMPLEAGGPLEADGCQKWKLKRNDRASGQCDQIKITKCL